MKKTRLSIILLLWLTFLCGIFVFASCGGVGFNNNGDNSTSSSPTPTKLTAPTVVLTDDIATWSANASADKFEISIDGDLSYIENSVTSRKLTDGQTFKVRAIGDGTNYSNSDWSNSVTYVKDTPKYTITWKNDDTVLEIDTNVPEGTVPSYNGEEPTKASSAQYSYVFSGWTPEVVETNGDATYTAVFTPIINKYTVTWKNGDTVLEVDENVTYGTTPVYNGVPPTKESDSENIYIFSGWSPAISSVTGDITYVAEFTNAANKHIVIFYDDDGVTELGRAVVNHGENATYPNSLPTKEPTAQITYTFEKWVTTKDGETEAIFTNITEDKYVYAKYSTNARTYVVTFCDYDGTILSQIDVAYGNSATAPGDPEREGYRFDGWDKIYSNITGDLTVKATYVQQFTVEFLDYDNSVIDIQLVDYNGSATAPQSPARNNYRFTGWNTGFTNIVSDLTVKAEYIRQYTVTFLDYDGTVLKETTIDAGSTAVAPNDPTLEGYIFDGWDKAFTNVSSDLTVTATYKVKTYTVKFVMPDGTTIGEVQRVEHGFPAIEPEYPEIFLVGTGINAKVYSFTRWDKTFDRVAGDLVIEAIYDTVYTKPVIIVDFGSAPHTSTNIYIYSHSSITLNAVELEIEYKTSVGEIEMDSVTFAGVFKENPQYVINNNEKKFSYAWSNAEGTSYDNCARLLTFDLDVIVGGTAIGDDTFIIKACNIIISDSNGENLEKIIPVVVYR